jgi:small subunit ribosomal protein S11
MAKVATKSRRRKTRRSIASGQVHIQATFNNTIISISDPNGQVIAWSSSGLAGFKGSRKSTPYAAQVAAERVAAGVKDYGMKQVDVANRLFDRFRLPA